MMYLLSFDIRTKLSNMNVNIRHKLRIIHVFEFCPLIDKRRRFHGILSKIQLNEKMRQITYIFNLR